MSPPGRQLSTQADLPSGPNPSQDVRGQHATDQAPAAAAAEVSDATAHGDADVAMSQEGRQSQPSPDNRTPPSHSWGLGSVDSTVRFPAASSAHEHTMQYSSAHQGEGIAQQPAPMPAGHPDPSAQDEAHLPQLAIEALGSDLGEEDEESGPEQESDSAMPDEEDRLGDLRLQYGDPGLGSESDFSHEPRSMSDVGTGEMELPEEGWMWSAVQTLLTSS